MITGTVNADYEAVIRLRVQGPTGHEHEVDAIIDTGFNGFLTLPPALVTVLELTRLSRGRALLANGSEDLFDIYGVTVLWDGQQWYVEADAVDTTPLWPRLDAELRGAHGKGLLAELLGQAADRGHVEVPAILSG